MSAPLPFRVEPSDAPRLAADAAVCSATRRDFLRRCATVTIATPLLSLPFAATLGSTANVQEPSAAESSAARQSSNNRQPLTFGLITDVHHGLAPDATERLKAFMASVAERDDLAFLMQLGDFCHPTDEGREFAALYQEFGGPKEHVLGNHDMDRGSKSQAIRTWGMRDRYYSFDAGAFHFVVLDMNNLRQDDGGQAKFTDYENGNYYIDARFRGWCDPQQLQWLANDLAATKLPTIIFSHQPLGIPETQQGLPPQQSQVMDVLHAANKQAPRVIACLSGHLHVDRHERAEQLHCLSINSASYHWAGGMHAYQDPLFAFVTLDPAGRIYVHGRHSEFVKAHPWEQGLNVNVSGVTASISDRAIVYHRQPA